MSLSILTILACLGGIFGAVAIFGFHRPKKLLYVTIVSICLVNFAFFRGEISSRVALPDVLFCILFLATLLQIAIQRDLSWQIPMGPSLIFGLLLLSITFSLTALPGRREVLFGEGQPESFLFTLGIFYITVGYLRKEDDLRNFGIAWAVSAFIALVFATVDMSDLFFPYQGVSKYNASGIFGIEDLLSFSSYPHAFLSPYSFRIQGSFRNPGQLANFAMTTSYVLLAFSFFPKLSRKTKAGLWAMVASLLVCAFLTTRVTSLITMCFGFLLVLLYLSFRSRRRMFGFLGVIILGVVFFMISSKINPEIYTKVISRNAVDISKFFKGSGFLNEQLASSLTILKDHPLEGIGFGRFIYSKYHPFIRGYEIHSTPLQFLAETGLIGISVYFLFLAYFIFLLIQAVRIAWKSPWRDFTVILLLGYVSMLPSCLYNRHLRERTFWLFISLIYIACRLIKEKHSAILSVKA